MTGVSSIIFFLTQLFYIKPSPWPCKYSSNSTSQVLFITKSFAGVTSLSTPATSVGSKEERVCGYVGSRLQHPLLGCVAWTVSSSVGRLSGIIRDEVKGESSICLILWLMSGKGIPCWKESASLQTTVSCFPGAWGHTASQVSIGNTCIQPGCHGPTPAHPPRECPLLTCLNLSTEQKQGHGRGAQPCGCQGKGEGVGWPGSSGLVDANDLEWIKSKVLLYSTGIISISCEETRWRVIWEKNVYKYIPRSLCCTADIDRIS